MTNLFHIYAFGSICRGEIEPSSDIDLLAITSVGSNQLSRNKFSIYSHMKIKEIWLHGNPFAWHLYKEAKLVYSSNEIDFIEKLGQPRKYTNSRNDCEKFLRIFRDSHSSLNENQSSVVFDLSAAFLGIRNFATCYLLGLGHFDFSRRVALNLMEDLSTAELNAYEILERARLLCTRGHGNALSATEIQVTAATLPSFDRRMVALLEECNND